MNPVVFKNMGGKITKLMLKWVPTPNKNLRERRVPMQKQLQKLLNIDDNFTPGLTEEILSQHDNIRVFYHFKEKVRSLYKAKNYQEAQKILESILEEMKTYKMWPALRKWQISLEKWKEEILNHFISKSSNGKVEGRNVVVKLLKRVSFGMRDTELYAKKIMLGPSP